VPQGPRPATTPTGCLPRGEDPIDVVATLAFATALLGLGHALARTPGPRGTLDRSASTHLHGGVRDPPDLRAVLPDDVPVLAARRWGTPSGFLSWGCPKIAPPSTKAEESTPGRFRALRGGVPRPPAFRPRGFSPPRRLAPLRPCGPVSSRCRSWGSPRFRRSRNRLPRSAILPYEAFPPPMATRNVAVARGAVSPPPLPSRPFLPALARPGPQGLAPSSGPLRVTPFPARRARCSHGLGWFIAPTVFRRIPRTR
jgi:hypothetical protein